MFDDLFGGMFDFNGDGHTDFAEEAVGFVIMDETMNDGEKWNEINDRRDEIEEEIDDLQFQLDMIDDEDARELLEDKIFGLEESLDDLDNEW